VDSVALVQLTASVGSGSSVKIKGDLIELNNIQIIRDTGSGLIQTQNFVAGTSGWRIKGDGNAEFNDVTVRGSVFVTGGDAATQTYADGVAGTAQTNAEAYADGVAQTAEDNANDLTAIVNYARQRVFRQATKPTSSGRPDLGPGFPANAFISGDIWIDTDDGDAPFSYDTVNSDFIRAYTQIDGGSITTGTVDANRIDVSGVITVGSISTEAYADGVAASALSDAEDYADGVGDTVSDATPRIFRQDDEPTTSNRSDSSLQDGDLWFDTDDGDAPYVYEASTPDWIAALTEINGNRITTGIINAGVVSIQNQSGTTPNVKINSTGITLRQIDATNDTEVSRSIHWINATDAGTIANQARLVSYASGSDIAIDVAGTENAKDFRFSVRRNISGNQDLSIGIVGIAGSFVTGSAVGDAIVSVSDGKLFLQQKNTTSGVISTYTLPFGSSEIVTDATGDAKYPRLTEINTFSDANTFNSGLLALSDTVDGFVVFKSGLQGDVRNLNIPVLGGTNRTIALIDQAQTFSAAQTFDSDVIVPDSTTSTHALQVGRADLRYGQLATANTWTGAQTVPNASANGHALNRTTGDGRYGRLATQSTYTADQIFEADRLNIKATSNTGLASFTYANTATDRTIAIPSLGGNRTMAFIDQEQGWNADQTFAFGRLLLRNTGGDGSASINYGTASADRTYTFAGSNGTVWTSGNLDIAPGGQVSVQPNDTLEIAINGNTYRIEAEQI
jgi:hypothetical protein